MQFATMEDVTGFNQKNAANDGEAMIAQALKALSKRYSDHLLEIIKLMLKFDESARPSFTELSKLVLTSTDNSIDSPKHGKSAKTIQSSKQTDPRKVNKVYSMRDFKQENLSLSDKPGSSKLQRKGTTELSMSNRLDDS